MLDVSESQDVLIWQTVFHRKQAGFTIKSALFAEVPGAKTVVAEIVPDGPTRVEVLYSKAK